MTTSPFDLDMGLLPLSSFAPYAPYALLTPPPVQRWLDALYSAQALAPVLANSLSLPHLPYPHSFDAAPEFAASAPRSADAMAIPPDLLTMLAHTSTVMSEALNVAAQQELVLFHRCLALQQALIFGAASAGETAALQASPTKARTVAKHK